MSKQGFPDCVYAQAADAYQASCVNKTLKCPRVPRHAPDPHPAAGDAGNERSMKKPQLLAYELAFNTLKCKSCH